MPRPDEGLIHAWLDGQLPPEEAARIEELAATDPEWAAAVAEARGLVAASSRILSALDHVPAGVVPKRTAARTGQRLPWWTKIAAAVVVVVGGSVVVMQNAPDERLSVVSAEKGSAQPTPDTQTIPAAVPVPTPPVPATATPDARAGMPVATGAGSHAGTAIGSEDSPAPRREVLAAQPAAPVAAPVTPPRTDVVAEQRIAQDAERMVAELSAPKSLVAKAAPRIAQGAAPGTAPGAAPGVAPSAAPGVAPGVAPSAAPQAQQSSMQDVAQAQNAIRAQRAMGGVVGAQRAQNRPATLCYRLVPDKVREGPAILMRAVRTAGDTLFLAPVEPNAPQQAWLILRDGMRGVMTTGGDPRSATRIMGTPAICPVP